ncbi:MAG: hypothetical protein WCT28_04065 [Patescibacteria group bacterium]|jgi:hypothetical protein
MKEPAEIVQIPQKETEVSESKKPTTEIALPELRQRLLRMNTSERIELGLNPSEHESAREKLDRIAALTEKLSHLTARVSIETYRRNQDEFAELLLQVQEIMSSLEIELITFEAAVETQYPKTTLMQKFVVALVAVVRGVRESTLMDTLGNNERMRATLLDAGAKLKEVVHSQERALRETSTTMAVDKLKITQKRYKKLLLENERYKNLMEENRIASSDLYICEGFEGPSAVDELNPRGTIIFQYFQKYEVSIEDTAMRKSAFEKVKEDLLFAIRAKIHILTSEISDIEKKTLKIAEEETQS